MKKIEPIQEREEDEYFSVVDPDGVLRCSCGRELEKMDEHTYKCPGGYPIYRFEDGTVFIDKHGNLMLKHIDHGGEQENEEEN